MFAPFSNRGLVNVFTNQVATPQQSHDMLRFREIGNDTFQQHVNYRVLTKPSTVAASIKKHKLLTLQPPKKVSKRKMNEKEKEMQDVNKLLCRRLEWYRVTGVSYDPSEDQCSVYPRALSDCSGKPHTGNKSAWTDKLRMRYNEEVVVTTVLPNGWVPQVVVIDSMFTLHTKPLRNMTITDYANFIFNRFVLPHYRAGTLEVHLIFDKEVRQLFDPKAFERDKRDQSGQSDNKHCCTEFTPDTQTPTSTHWADYIHCRSCKRSIINSIGLAFINTTRYKLKDRQQLVLAGCFDCDDNNQVCILSAHTLPQPTSMYSTNAEETDMIIWHHVQITPHSNILIYLPDTDVYNIGLAFIEHLEKEIIVQINVLSKDDK